MHFSVVSCIGNTLLNKNYLTRATLPRKNAEKYAYSSAWCASVYPNNPTNPIILLSNYCAQCSPIKSPQLIHGVFTMMLNVPVSVEALNKHRKVNGKCNVKTNYQESIYSNKKTLLKVTFTFTNILIHCCHEPFVACAAVWPTSVDACAVLAASGKAPTFVNVWKEKNTS